MLPEQNLEIGRRVLALLEERLRVLLQDGLDLLGPRDDRPLEEWDAVLGRGVVAGGPRGRSLRVDGRIGRRVSPLIWPHMMVELERNR